jgi:SNF2 family DNA or RNA helicase
MGVFGVLVQHPFQRDGTQWIADRLRRSNNRAVFLCDEPGLGKTSQTLAALDAMHLGRVLTVCPAGVRHVWKSEIDRWFPQWSHRVVLLEPGAPPPSDAALVADDLILIISYDALSQAANPLHARLMLAPRWDCLVLDEAHYCKNPSNRTHAIYGTRGQGGLQSRADAVILLTGTPAPNHLGELYRHLLALWPDLITRTHRPMSEPEFQERYTRYRDGVYGRQILGSRNQQELRDLLRPVFLRRTKAQVLPELPPLVLQDVALG